MRGTNGLVIKETMVWLDDEVIELKLKVDFFQFSMEVGRELMLRRCRLPIVDIAPRF